MIRLASLLLLLLFFWSCGDGPKPERASSAQVDEIYGEAQGTTFAVKFLNPNDVPVSKAQIDSILLVIDQSLSTWVSGSTISRFNRTDSIAIDDPHFINVFFRGKEISELTAGAFHPMVMPLAKAWGFGPEGGTIGDHVNLDSLKKLVDYTMRIDVMNDTSSTEPLQLLFVKRPGQQMDVNSYAQGYAVDVIAEFIEKRGISDYMIELGGELRAKGVNEKGEFWRIGIDKPMQKEGTRELQSILSLKDASLATSGTYRKFYERNGKKYSHTIDPSTGMPVDHNLLSVTVLAPNCINADAFATAFLVMGLEKTKAFLETHPNLGLEIYLIFDSGSDELSTYASPRMKEWVEEL
jgi:thiamine biosynthesis lipoprotein